MNCYGLTDCGRIRTENQDFFSIKKGNIFKPYYFAVCDGMGGANAGGLASGMGCKLFLDYLCKHNTRKSSGISENYKSSLFQAVDHANTAVFDYSFQNDSFSGMGTTLVGGVVKQNGNVSIVNIGDSRAYHITGKDKAVRQITRDHSLVEDLYESGVISKEQAKIHPQKNVITRALGSDPVVRADFFEFTCCRNDRLVICTDGLSNIISDEEILRAALSSSSSETVCRKLMQEALGRSASDNVTVVTFVF